MEAVYKFLPHNSALEFGCGNYSTTWLLSHFDHVDSVETSTDWIGTLRGSLDPDSQSRWTYLVVDDERDFWWTRDLRRYDLILIDGAIISARRNIAQICVSLDLAPAIVLHDTDCGAFEYNRLMLTPGTYQVESRKYKPWTAVICNSKEIADAIE